MLRSRVFATVLAACAMPFALSTGVLAGVNSWTTQGPPGGVHVGDLAASSTDPNVFYAGFGRVFFRSVDGAATWQAVGGLAGQIDDITVDPTDGRRIYVVVFDRGLYRSEDGGDTFTLIASTFSISSVGVGGDDGRTVYYATGSGQVFRSPDRGATWTQRGSGFQTIYRLYVEGADGSGIIGLRGPYLMRSADAGLTWSETTLDPGLNAWLYAFVRLSPTHLVMGAGDGAYVSMDNGGTWIRRGLGAFASVVRDPLVPTTLYGGIYWSDRMWRSVDSGQTWSPTGAQLIVDARALLVRANGGDRRFVVASPPGVMHSQNEGATWTESTSGPVASGPYRMASTTAANSRVFAYMDTGGLFSSSLASNWQRIDLAPVRALLGGNTLGQAAFAVKPGDPRTLYLLPVSQPLLVSTNGGGTWSTTGGSLTGLSANALAFDPVDSAIMYAALYSGFGSPAANLYRSTNGGVSWDPYSVDLPGVYPLSMTVDPSNRNRIFVASYQGYFPANTGGLYRSTNGGRNWTERGFLNMDVRNVVIDPADSNRVYAATNLGLQVSTDGGDTFTRNNPFTQLSNLSAGAVVIDPTVPTTLYVASVDPGYGFGTQQSSTIARSVNRGQTWEVLRSANEPLPWYVGEMVLDPNMPSLLYVNTTGRGVATYEIQNDLTVALSGHSGTKPIGVASSLTARVEHHGALAATAARLVITMPAGITAVTATPTSGSCVISGVSPICDFPVLLPAAGVNVEVSYTAPVALELPVTARIEAHERDNVAANDSAQASAISGEVVDLRLAVTPSATTVDHGDALSYAVVVRNEGPVTASVAAVAFIPGTGLTLGAPPTGCTAAGSQIACIFNGLAPGAERSVTINATASAVGPLTANVAVAAAPTALDTNSGNNAAAPAITSRSVADLVITATDSADPVQTATAFNYVVDVRNNGPDEMPAVAATLTAAGTVTSATSTRGTCTVAGTGVTCAVGALASGAAATITVVTSVATAGANTLHAAVAGGGTDRVAANNSVDQQTTVNAPVSSSSSGRGKGGGGFDALLLLALAALLAWRASAPSNDPGRGATALRSRSRAARARAR